MGILHQVRVKTAMKLLSTFLTLAIFSIVTFPNSECQSTKDKENKGVCYSSTECSEKGGVAEGNCAAGFGVCCIIKIKSKTGGTISHNATIIEKSSGALGHGLLGDADLSGPLDNGVLQDGAFTLLSPQRLGNLGGDIVFLVALLVFPLQLLLDQ